MLLSTPPQSNVAGLEALSGGAVPEGVTGVRSAEVGQVKRVAVKVAVICYPPD